MHARQHHPRRSTLRPRGTQLGARSGAPWRGSPRTVRAGTGGIRWGALGLAIGALGVATSIVWRTQVIGPLIAGSLAMYALFWWGGIECDGTSQAPPAHLLNSLVNMVREVSKAISRRKGKVSKPAGNKVAAAPTKTAPSP